MKNFAEFVVRNKYIDRNGGIYNIVNDIDKKKKYEKFLQKLYKYEINWKQEAKYSKKMKKVIKVSKKRKGK
jgi:hypothetical protein